MSHDFIENALTRLRDDSELVALRADKVRLTAEVSCLEAVIRSHERVDCLMVTSLKDQLVEVDAEVARLKAEVERLTKAGDAMAKRTEFFQKRWDADELCQEVEAWLAAKEGKQS